MAEPDTLCGWGDQDKVDYFVQRSAFLIPKRLEQLNTLLDLFPWSADEPIRVLDLGAGYGAVTETILSVIHTQQSSGLTARPPCTSMLGPASTNMARTLNFFCATWLILPGMSVCPDRFMPAVSAIALHHLTDSRKGQLCAEVFNLLQPGGLFLNNDVVAGRPGVPRPVYAPGRSSDSAAGPGTDWRAPLARRNSPSADRPAASRGAAQPHRSAGASAQLVARGRLYDCRLLLEISEFCDFWRFQAPSRELRRAHVSSMSDSS